LTGGKSGTSLYLGKAARKFAYNLPLDLEMQDMNEVRRGPDRSYVYVQLR
jgi:hypothetical protein